MFGLRRPVVPPRAAAPGSLAVIHCPEAFTLEPGHRLRAARCLVCRQLIGGQAVTVIGVAALAGEACRCGGVVSDTFLVHAIHMPIGTRQLTAAIHRGLSCGQVHQ